MTYHEINTNQHCIPALTSKIPHGPNVSLKYELALVPRSLAWCQNLVAEVAPPQVTERGALPQPRHAIAMDEPGYEHNGF